METERQGEEDFLSIRGTKHLSAKFSGGREVSGT